MAETYYQILNLSRSATAADIKKQFRKLAVQHHPDKNPDNPAAEAMMKKINAAYTILSDSMLRKKYNDQLDYKNPPPPQSDTNRGFTGWSNQQHQNKTHHGSHQFEGWDQFFNRIMEGFLHDNTFNNVFDVHRKDYILVIDVTPEEAKNGCKKPLNYVTTEKCTVCQGRFFNSGKCPHCDNGLITIKSKFNMAQLPSGMTQGSKWISEQELTAYPTGKKHDLYIHINIVDIDGKSQYDAQMVIVIPLETAFKGGDFRVVSPRGLIKVKLPELCFTGKTVRVVNRGHYNAATGQIGNLFLTCKIDVPKNLTQTQQHQLSKILEKQKEHEYHN